MDSLRFRLRVFLLLLFGVTVVGTVGSMIIERLSLGDALYFSIVTIATVGYGDIHPATPGGKFLAIFLIVMGVGTFLGVVANATELMLNKREQKARMEKLNMVIGAFFSEVGTRLLGVFSDASPDLEALRGELHVATDWTDQDFSKARARLRKADLTIEIERIDLEALCELLVSKRGFLLRLLENPVLLEHETFTDLLWAVFHLTEELTCREDKTSLPDTDRAHLLGDAARAYRRLVVQWLDYARHLKRRYPYLFSLAVRTNPFDREASPIVR